MITNLSAPDEFLADISSKSLSCSFYDFGKKQRYNQLNLRIPSNQHLVIHGF